jgi:hypothetical protein
MAQVPHQPAERSGRHVIGQGIERIGRIRHSAVLVL